MLIVDVDGRAAALLTVGLSKSFMKISSLLLLFVKLIRVCDHSQSQTIDKTWALSWSTIHLIKRWLSQHQKKKRKKKIRIRKQKTFHQNITYLCQRRRLTDAKFPYLGVKCCYLVISTYGNKKAIEGYRTPVLGN